MKKQNAPVFSFPITLEEPRLEMRTAAIVSLNPQALSAHGFSAPGLATFPARPFSRAKRSWTVGQNGLSQNGFSQTDWLPSVLLVMFLRLSFSSWSNASMKRWFIFSSCLRKNLLSFCCELNSKRFAHPAGPIAAQFSVANGQWLRESSLPDMEFSLRPWTPEKLFAS